MKKKISFYALLCLTFLAYSANSQDTAKVEISTSSFVEINGHLGGLVNDNTSLNSALKEVSMPELEATIPGLGGSILLSIDKSIFRNVVWGLGGNYNSAVIKGQGEGDYTSLRIFSRDLSIGYIVLERSNFYLFPYLGLNVNSAKLHLSKKDTLSKVVDFNQIPSLESTTKTISFSNQSLDMGLFGQRIFKERTIGSCPRNVRYFSVGLKVGYLLSLKNKSSNGGYNFHPISDGPNFGLEGFYFKATFGYGIRFRKVGWN